MPPRMLVFPDPVGSSAKPTRGAQSFLSGKLEPLGAPESPGNRRETGAFTNRVDCAPGTMLKERPCVSSLGELYSYRVPRVSTSRRLTCHSSCTKPNVDFCRMLEGALPNWK